MGAGWGLGTGIVGSRRRLPLNRPDRRQLLDCLGRVGQPKNRVVVQRGPIVGVTHDPLGNLRDHANTGQIRHLPRKYLDQTSETKPSRGRLMSSGKIQKENVSIFCKRSV